jgi:predicted amino acid racemase
MAQLSSLAGSIERHVGGPLLTVSGGNSANLEWASRTRDTGRINDLRLGEAIHLGREPLGRTAIDDLHVDVYTLVTEVIEAKVKPAVPWGDLGQAAFGTVGSSPSDGVGLTRVIAAVGRQDIDPDGLGPPSGMVIVGASSDHLLLCSHDPPPRIGSELRMRIQGYGALLRAMTSPFVARQYLQPG